MSRDSSKVRFQKYRQMVQDRRLKGEKEGKKQKEGGRSFWELLAAFWGLLHGQRGAVVLALATLTFSTLLRLAPPASTKFVIDYVLGDLPLPEPWGAWLAGLGDKQVWLAAVCTAVVGVSLVESLLHVWGRWYATKAVNRLQAKVRREAFEHAVRLPLHRVYQLKSGGVSSLLREDAGSVAELIFSMIYNPWQAVVQLLGSLAVLAWVDWRLMLGGLLLLPVVYFSHRTWITRIRPLYRDIRNQRQDIDGHSAEAFSGMRVVRAFGRVRSEADRFVKGNHLMIRQQLLAWVWSRFIELVWQILIPLASAALLFYGGSRILQGELTLGDLTMFLFYLTMLLGPLAMLAGSATAFQNSLAGLDRVLDLLDESLEFAETNAAVTQSISAAQTAGRVELLDISFHYPGSQRQVLQDINLTVEPGETVALVGRSGAGKTTLCNLVARFFDPTAGSVLLDGVDLRKIKLDDYRQLLGIVEQDVFLFDGTIADNISYARRQATAAEISQAARDAHAEEFIEQMEAGYQTVIGERGVKLSGGQRQRLAIARAILAEPRILILDEATSNLDSESERYIQHSLARLMQGRTSFVIAHRLSTIIHADRIVVLDDGKLVEQGTHQELMSRSSLYRHMVELQMTEPTETDVQELERN